MNSSVPSAGRTTLPGTTRAREVADNRRKYARIGADEPGVLVGRAPTVGDAPIRVVCVSPSGVRFDIDDDLAERCAPGAQVVLRFGSSQLPFELPGKVVWMRRAGRVASVGVALRLEVAAALMRHGYAQWVVGRLSAGRR